MKLAIYIYVIFIIICTRSTHAQKYSHTFKLKNLAHNQLTIQTDVLGEHGEIIYCEKKYINNINDAYIDSHFNFAVLDIPKLRKVKTLKVSLLDSLKLLMEDSISNAEIENLLCQTIINKIESERLLHMENALIEMGVLDQITFWHNGELVTYGVVNHRGRYWLDRNLGASQVAKSMLDTLSFGDLFQWGREADGHELRDNIVTTDELVQLREQPAHNSIIYAKNRDWTTDDDWTRRWFNGSPFVEYSCNVCPSGWHVPNEYEWGIAISQWKNKKDAFQSVLKLPSTTSRWREIINDNINKPNYSVHYWSSSNSSEKGNAFATFFNEREVKIYGVYNRKIGFPVRCIKNKVAE